MFSKTRGGKGRPPECMFEPTHACCPVPLTIMKDVSPILRRGTCFNGKKPLSIPPLQSSSNRNGSFLGNATVNLTVGDGCQGPGGFLRKEEERSCVQQRYKGTVLVFPPPLGYFRLRVWSVALFIHLFFFLPPIKPAQTVKIAEPHHGLAPMCQSIFFRAGSTGAAATELVIFTNAYHLAGVGRGRRNCFVP